MDNPLTPFEGYSFDANIPQMQVAHSATFEMADAPPYPETAYNFASPAHFDWGALALAQPQTLYPQFAQPQEYAQLDVPQQHKLTPPQEFSQDLAPIVAAAPTVALAPTSTASPKASSVKDKDIPQGGEVRVPKKRGRKKKIITPEEETVKRGAFLERNRIAAYKCREGKKKANQTLAERARELEVENRDLLAEVLQLRRERDGLRQHLQHHMLEVHGQGWLAESSPPGHEYHDISEQDGGNVAFQTPGMQRTGSNFTQSTASTPMSGDSSQQDTQLTELSPPDHYAELSGFTLPFNDGPGLASFDNMAQNMDMAQFVNLQEE